MKLRAQLFGSLAVLGFVLLVIGFLIIFLPPVIIPPPSLFPIADICAGTGVFMFLASTLLYWRNISGLRWAKYLEIQQTQLRILKAIADSGRPPVDEQAAIGRNEAEREIIYRRKEIEKHQQRIDHLVGQ